MLGTMAHAWIQQENHPRTLPSPDALIYTNEVRKAFSFPSVPAKSSVQVFLRASAIPVILKVWLWARGFSKMWKHVRTLQDPLGQEP